MPRNLFKAHLSFTRASTREYSSFNKTAEWTQSMYKWLASKKLREYFKNSKFIYIIVTAKNISVESSKRVDIKFFLNHNVNKMLPREREMKLSTQEKRVCRRFSYIKMTIYHMEKIQNSFPNCFHQ